MALTILIADDDDQVRELFAAFAAERGHRVVHARNGAEVLARVAEQQPDAIVLDVLMDGPEGAALIGRLADAGHRNIPVVMLSAVGGPFTRERCLALGAVDYFEKPFHGHVVLPRLEAITAAIRAGNPLPHPGDERLLVLMAEDDAVIRELFADAGQKYGFRVVQATNGDEVLPLVERERPDVIVLDVMMPRLDGPGVLQKLREEGHGDIPVVMLSAVGGPYTRDRCLELGALDYVTKPFRGAELFRRLTALANAARSLRAGAA